MALIEAKLALRDREGDGGGDRERLSPSELGFFLHAYQPPRDIALPSGRRLEVLPWINEQIYHESYKPALVDGENLPEAVTFSLYGTLREWIKANHPEDIERLRQKIGKEKNREYRLLGDSYLHVILPLLDQEDQATLVEIGRQAFREDLGFVPQGFWLPETAVSSGVLDVLHRHGYRYVVLKDYQLKSNGTNPVRVSLKSGETMAVFHFDAPTSDDVSFKDETTMNGDDFLHRVGWQNGHGLLLGTDFETFGHHKKGRQWFLRYVADQRTLKQHGFSPLDVSSRLLTVDQQTAQIREQSSWSCQHQLGRWTGECDCDDPSVQARQDKRDFFQKLLVYQRVINRRLDEISPSWRNDFIRTFLLIRKGLFSGDDISQSVGVLIPDEEIRRLFLAKTCAFIGMTSCGWFFGGENSPEREIPKTMIEEIESLF